MTTSEAGRDDHPWHLHLHVDPAEDAHERDAIGALAALDKLGATVIAVHADHLPSLADIVAGRAYVGWTIAVPGSVDRNSLDAIIATVGTRFRASLAPGHPLPPTADRP